MTSKQRVLAILNREPVDRFPVDLWCTDEIRAQLKRHFRVESDLDLWRAMGIDKLGWAFIGYKLPDETSTGAQPGAEAVARRGLWGTTFRNIQAGEAAYSEVDEFGLAGYDTSASLNSYPYWPDPERFNYDRQYEQASAPSGEFAVLGPWVSFYEIYCQMRGLEQAMLDLAENPAYVDAVLDRIEAIQTEMLQRVFRRSGKLIDLVFLSDDIGGQTGLLLSPESWRRHLKPRMQRWCRLIHDAGIRVFFHSDGGFEPVIPELIECGIDVLNPIQHVCPGMDRATLKKKYGDRIIFHGGVDNQFALPRGTVEDVRRETLECLRTLGSDGKGYICCSCHNVQPGTPVENVLEMVRVVKEYRG